MDRETLVVRKVNKRIYKKFKQKALEEETNIGEAITEAMRYWLEAKDAKQKKNIKNLLKLNGIIKTNKKKVYWSRDIDKILYGGES